MASHGASLLPLSNCFSDQALSVRTSLGRDSSVVVSGTANGDGHVDSNRAFRSTGA